MEMEESNKNENKGHLGLMDLIIIGLSIFLFALVIKWFVFMDLGLTPKDRIKSVTIFVKEFVEKS